MKHGVGLCRVRAGQEYTFPRLVQRLQGEKSLYLHRRLQALVLTRARVLVRWSVGTLLDGNAHRSANTYAVVQCGRASCVVRGRAAVGRHDNKYCADGTTARLLSHLQCVQPYREYFYKEASKRRSNQEKRRVYSPR
jgi:hypothetical protein